MKNLLIFLAALVPLSVSAQSQDLAEAMTLGINYALDQTSIEGGGPIVLDTARTAPDAHAARAVLLADVLGGIGAKAGIVEDYCFRVPASGEAELKKMLVRGARAVVAAEVVELTGDQLVLRVAVWRGAGYHTGVVHTLSLQREAGEWRTPESLTMATTGCIPAG